VKVRVKVEFGHGRAALQMFETPNDTGGTEVDTLSVRAVKGMGRPKLIAAEVVKSMTKFFTSWHRGAEVAGAAIPAN
jgi:hypothetical protein